MPYPGTIDNWFDHSGAQARVPVERYPRPLILAAAAFDRGPERMNVIHGQDFYKTYGYYIDFDKYGQAAIQVANAIDNGADVLLKRVVAPDATLANIVICAKVQKQVVQKTDAEGNPLYIEPNTHLETTNDGSGGYEKATINVASISYETVTIEKCKNLSEVMNAAADLRDDDACPKVFPLFVITDCGRGESTKRFGIEPLYTISKNQNFMLYKLKYLGSKDLDAEEVYFAMKPGIMYIGKSMDIGMSSHEMLQCEARALEDSINAFYTAVSEITGIDEKSLYQDDLLFCKSNKGAQVQGLSMADDSQNLGVDMGFGLASGTNGSFGDKPIDTEEYEAELHNFFSGEFNEDIYNLDMYKIDACIDANYPMQVKKDIIALADFRKDFMFFGDLGLDINSYTNAVETMYEMPRSRFAAWYGQSFQVLNPFTQRAIDVTITYVIARVIVSHLINARHVPYCGIMHNWTFPEVIEGTVNFTPKITPKYNQKEQLGELQLNYASILRDVLTMETEYTSQTELTQLSYINNVAIIQKIIKDVRDNCPAFRYSFIDGEDLAKYKANVTNILSKYTTYFESLEFVYVQDEIMKANKIFEADIKVKHRDFIQQEIFNIYTLGTELATEASADTSLQTYYDGTRE